MHMCCVCTCVLCVHRYACVLCVLCVHMCAVCAQGVRGHEHMHAHAGGAHKPKPWLLELGAPRYQ